MACEEVGFQTSYTPTITNTSHPSNEYTRSSTPTLKGAITDYLRISGNKSSLPLPRPKDPLAAMFLFFPVDAKLDLGRRLTRWGSGVWGRQVLQKTLQIHDLTQDLHDIISFGNGKTPQNKYVCPFSPHSTLLPCHLHIWENIISYIVDAVMLQLLDPPSTTHTRLRRIVHLAPPPKKAAAAVSSITCHGGWKMSRDVGKITQDSLRTAMI